MKNELCEKMLCVITVEIAAKKYYGYNIIMQTYCGNAELLQSNQEECSLTWNNEQKYLKIISIIQ